MHPKLTNVASSLDPGCNQMLNPVFNITDTYERKNEDLEVLSTREPININYNPNLISHKEYNPKKGRQLRTRTQGGYRSTNFSKTDNRMILDKRSERAKLVIQEVDNTLDASKNLFFKRTQIKGQR